MKLFRLFAALVIALCPFATKADQFNFSYLFGSGDLVTGSLFGTQNGLYVESVSNVSVFLNGNALNGNPDLYQPIYFAAGCCFVPGAPAISFDANLNNFIFSDNATNYFGMNGTDIDYWNTGSLLPLRHAYIVTGIVNNAATFTTADVSIGGLAYGGAPAYDPSHWVLTPVPEPETYAMLLAGLGLLGFAARRRQRKSARA